MLASTHIDTCTRMHIHTKVTHATRTCSPAHTHTHMLTCTCSPAHTRAHIEV